MCGLSFDRRRRRLLGKLRLLDRPFPGGRRDPGNDLWRETQILVIFAPERLLNQTHSTDSMSDNAVRTSGAPTTCLPATYPAIITRSQRALITRGIPFA